MFPLVHIVKSPKDLENYSNLLHDPNIVAIVSESVLNRERAWVSLRKGNLTGALKYFEKALSENDKDIQTLTEYIDLKLNLGEYKSIQKDIDKLKKLSSCPIFSNNATAYIKIKEKKFVEALRILNENFLIDEDDKKTNQLFSVLYFVQNDFIKAEESLNRIYIGKSDFGLLIFKAKILFFQDKFIEAEKIFKDVIYRFKHGDSFPEFLSIAFYFLAHIHLKQDNINSAILMFKKSVSYSINNINLNDLGVAYWVPLNI